MNGEWVWRLTIFLAGILSTGSIGLTGWSLTQVVGIRERLARIESNRFTTKDGVVMEHSLRLEMNEIFEDMPPVWFIERVKRIEDDVYAIKNQKKGR